MIGHVLPSEPLFTAKHSSVSIGRPNGLHGLFAAEPSKLFKPGETLFTQGNFKTAAYMVESGSALVCRMRADGTRRIVRFAFPGDLIGLESGDEHFYEAQALALTRVRTLPHLRLLKHASGDPRLAREMLDVLSQDISEAHEHLFTVVDLTAKTRVASFLVSLARRNALKGLPASTLTLPGRRCDMADFLCMSIETVSRALTGLKRAKVISLRGRNLIEINNAVMLQRFASAS
jgi:CRP-like cAMP-binding protein